MNEINKLAEEISNTMVDIFTRYEMPYTELISILLEITLTLIQQAENLDDTSSKRKLREYVSQYMHVYFKNRKS